MQKDSHVEGVDGNPTLRDLLPLKESDVFQRFPPRKKGIGLPPVNCEFPSVEIFLKVNSSR